MTTIRLRGAEEVATPVVVAPVKASSRIQGIDTLRFFLALWVVMAHLISGHPNSPFLLKALQLPFPGITAVMAFFVISGLCIHLPYVQGRPVKLPEFYLRREVRILPPILAVAALGLVLKNFAFTLVVWSLICEEIYYLLYPLLLKIRTRFGWGLLLAGSTIACLAVGLLGGAHSYTFFEQGPFLTWILGLPVWLLGAVLAEEVVKPGPVPSVGSIWTWRVSIIAVARLSTVLHLYTPIGTQISLPWMGALCYFWILREIRYFGAHPPSRVLETLGLASYSLYLIHLEFMEAAQRFFGDADLNPVRWLAALLGTAIGTAALYFLVEKPSHLLARKLGRPRTKLGSA